ncbi:MAG: CotS family spore coat protein [Clostridium sp.]
MVGRVRYAEKKYLCKYNLTDEFFNAMGIEVLESIPLRKLFILDTFKGKKILKRVEYDKDRIKFISKSLEYIGKKFNNIISFDKFNEVNNYFEWDDNLYIMMDVIKGREVTFSNEIEVQLCAQSIARYHESGNGIRTFLEKEMGEEVKIENLMLKYKESLDQIKKIYSMISNYKNKNSFDKIVIDIYSKLLGDMEQSINWIENSVNIEKMIKDDNNIILCHNDLAHHNFLIEEGIISILDFDYCSIDLRVVDLADFIIKSIKSSAYDVDKGVQAIKAYTDIIKLTDDEFKLLYGILMFPKEIYSMIKSYYYKEKEWDEDTFLSRIITKVENEEFRTIFANELKEIYIYNK